MIITFRGRHRYEGVIVGPYSGTATPIPGARFRTEEQAADWCQRQNDDHNKGPLVRYAYRPIGR